MSFGGGSSNSRQSGTTTQTGRALEPEEKELLESQKKLLDMELQQLTRQNEALEAIFPEAKEILRGLTEATSKAVGVFSSALDSLRETPGEKEIRGVSEQEALKTLRGEAPVVTEQEQKLLDTVFDAVEKRGIENITRFAQDAAAARGLKVTDTPIGSEATRAVGEFSRDLGGQRAQATLDVGRTGQQFREAVRQFQEGLRFQAQQNRLALTGQSPFALQAPISTVSPAQAGQNFASTLGVLTGRPTDTSFSTKGRGTFSTWGVDIGQIVGAAGAALTGASSARLKKDILPLDRDEYDKALDKLKDTPLVRYRYKWEGADTRRVPHFGPLLELSPEEIRENDTYVNVLDYSGLLHAGLRAVERRVARLEISK